MELSNTVHRLTEFYEELEETGCTEMILVGVKWTEEGTVPERIVLHRNSASANTTIVPLSLSLALAAKEMNAQKVMEVQSPFGKVIIVTDDAMPLDFQDGEE